MSKLSFQFAQSSSLRSLAALLRCSTLAALSQLREPGSGQMLPALHGEANIIVTFAQSPKK